MKGLNLVKEYRWNDDKNQLLQQERGILLKMLFKQLVMEV
jgi:hypothetical protein